MKYTKSHKMKILFCLDILIDHYVIPNIINIDNITNFMFLLFFMF